MSSGLQGFSGNRFKALVSRILPRADAKEQYEIDPGVLQLLMRPAALNPEDDHFNDSFVNTKWLLTTANNSLTVLPGWLQLNSTRIIQPVPAGDWSIETEAMLPTYTSAGFYTAGLTMHDSATATGNQARWIFGMDNSLVNSYFQMAKDLNGSFSSAYFQFTALERMDNMFMRIVKTGTTYTCDYSTKGKRWSRAGSTSALGFTPTHFGLYGSGGSYFNYFIRR